VKQLHDSGAECALKLDETELEQVRGGADAGTSTSEDWTTRDPYLMIRQESIVAREAAYDRAWDGLGDGKPLEIVHAARDWAVAKEAQNWAEQNLNYINHREEEAREASGRAADAELAELERLEQEAQEEEEAEWLLEAEAMDREAAAGSATASGGDARVPVNGELYTGELPSFPTWIVNPPPPHTPQIILEPVDGDQGSFY
jgi:hypothetical protein